MGIVYGIDFGTSNSSVAVAGDDGVVVTVKDPGSTTNSFAIPTTLCVRPDGEILIGSAAERLKAVYPQHYRREFKRDFGSDQPSVFGAGHLLPHELAALVLRFLREAAEAAVPGEPEQVVITVPTSWERGNRDLMRGCAAQAGFPIDRVTLQHEPVAAALQAFDLTGGIQRILVYDLGGGTFDCAIVRRTKSGGFRAMGAPGGLDTVGGGEFDRLILARIRETFPAEADALLTGPAADAGALRRRIELRDACEALKMRLSVVPEHTADLPMLGPGCSLRLSRTELEKIVEKLLEETLDECQRLLFAQGLGWQDIDRVVTVGGSSRLPLVGELLARRVAGATTVLNVPDPELAVVRGAVRKAHALAHPPPRPVRAPKPKTKPNEIAPAPPVHTPVPYRPSPTPVPYSGSGRFKDTLVGAGIGAVVGALIGAVFLGVGAFPGVVVGAIIGAWKGYHAT